MEMTNFTVVREVLRNKYWSHHLIGLYRFWVIFPKNSTSFTRLSPGGVCRVGTRLLIILRTHYKLYKCTLNWCLILSCVSFVCDGKPFLRVFVVGKKVNTSLQEGLDLWVAGGCLFLQEDRGQHLQKLWHSICQGHQPQLV